MSSYYCKSGWHKSVHCLVSIIMIFLWFLVAIFLNILTQWYWCQIENLFWMLVLQPLPFYKQEVLKSKQFFGHRFWVIQLWNTEWYWYKYPKLMRNMFIDGGGGMGEKIGIFAFNIVKWRLPIQGQNQIFMYMCRKIWVKHWSDISIKFSLRYHCKHSHLLKLKTQTVHWTYI